MKLNGNAATAGLLGLTLLVFFVAAAPASAQEIVRYNGRFTLPYEVQWGSTVLPPGEYSLTFTTLSSSVDLVTVRGDRKTAMITVNGTRYCKSCEDHELVVVRRKGQRAVQAMHARGLRAFFFAQEEEGKGNEQAKQTAPAERIPLTSGRK